MKRVALEKVHMGIFCTYFKIFKNLETMRSRVVQIILLGGLVLSCRKNFDSIEEQTPSAVVKQSSEFVSSDTAFESESFSNGRTVTRSYWLTSKSPAEEGSAVTIKMNTTNFEK